MGEDGVIGYFATFYFPQILLIGAEGKVEIACDWSDWIFCYVLYHAKTQRLKTHLLAVGAIGYFAIIISRRSR